MDREVDNNDDGGFMQEQRRASAIIVEEFRTDRCSLIQTDTFIMGVKKVNKKAALMHQ